MTKQTTKFGILILLASMFAAPGLAAYLFYKHPQWISSVHLNRGTLLNPPQVLNVLDQKKKWRVVLWYPRGCNQSCLKQMDLVARIRLALGRRLYQVDQWLILGDNAPLLDEEASKIAQELDFKVVKIANSAQDMSLPPRTQVYIANPDRYLVLSYKAKFAPEDIYKDLQQLLKIPVSTATPRGQARDVRA